MATSVHSGMQRHFLFRRGMEAMPWLVHTKRIGALFLLSASKAGSLKSRQLIWKSPGNQDHRHNSLHIHTPSNAGNLSPEAAKGGFSGQTARRFFSWKTLCARTGFKSTKGLLWMCFSPGSTTGLVWTLPPVPQKHSHASFALHHSLEGANDCLL